MIGTTVAGTTRLIMIPFSDLGFSKENKNMTVLRCIIIKIKFNYGVGLQ
jgi:hypothetical protein